MHQMLQIGLMQHDIVPTSSQVEQWLLERLSDEPDAQRDREKARASGLCVSAYRCSLTDPDSPA